MRYKAVVWAVIGSVTFAPLLASAAIYRNYNLGDDNATNYEVGEAVWTGNVFQLKTRAGGTGTLRTIQLTTGTGQGLVVDSSGEVGIGIASPTALLHIGGIATAADQEFFKVGVDGEFSGIIKFFDDDAESTQNFQISFSASSEDLKFRSDEVDNILYLDNAGNVGISDGTPTEGKLVVGGTGYFTNTVTVGTPTADTHAATKSYVDSATVGQTGWTALAAADFTAATLTNVAAFLSEAYANDGTNSDKATFVLNNGTNSYVYAFNAAAGTTTAIVAAELTLIGVVSNYGLLAADVAQA